MTLRPSRLLPATLLVLLGAAAWTAPKDIYPPTRRADADLAAALEEATREHKHVIVDFGGNWCPDCLVLDHYFHDGTNRPLLEASYVLVHVNVGHLDENRDIASRFAIPLNKGVPALAVLGEDGKVIYSQQAGEFEAMRGMQSAAVTEFLQHWK